MLQNAYLLAKIGDTAENERHFAEICQKLATTLRIHRAAWRALPDAAAAAASGVRGADRELDHGVAVVVLVEMLMLDPMDMRAVCPHLVDEIVVGRRVGNGNLSAKALD